MPQDRRWIILLGAIQGLLLLAGHEVMARDWWPARHPPAVLAWYAVAVGVPLAIQLLWGDASRRLARFGFGLTLVLAALGAYAGYAAGGPGPDYPAPDHFTFALSIGAAWFMALPFAALWVRSGRLRFPYQELFSQASANTVALAFGALFTGIFWALLALWAGLFHLIGIELFSNLFMRREFAWPASSMAFAFALSLGQSHRAAAPTLRRVMLAGSRGLLPLVSLMALLFLCFLPFTGVGALWDTGHASALTLATQTAMILLLNAAYQDGTGEAPFNPWVRRVVELAVAALPVYGALTLYALALRVAQYGWTGARVWAVLLAVVAALCGFGYLAAVLARRGPWLAWVAPVNVMLALVTVVLLVAANSPLLDPMRIGAESQLNRLLTGQVAAEEFDYGYLRFEAGRYGLQALNRLAEESGPGDSDLFKTRAKAALAATRRWSAPAIGTPPLAHVNVFPDGRALDPEFLQFLGGRQEPGGENCAAPRQDCMLLALDLNRDGRDEYVQFYYPNYLFTKGPSGWRVAGRITVQGLQDRSQLRAALEHGDYGPRSPLWPDLEVGGRRYGIVVEPPAGD